MSQPFLTEHFPASSLVGEDVSALQERIAPVDAQVSAILSKIGLPHLKLTNDEGREIATRGLETNAGLVQVRYGIYQPNGTIITVVEGSAFSVSGVSERTETLKNGVTTTSVTMSKKLIDERPSVHMGEVFNYIRENAKLLKIDDTRLTAQLLEGAAEEYTYVSCEGIVVNGMHKIIPGDLYSSEGEKLRGFPEVSKIYDNNPYRVNAFILGAFVLARSILRDVEQHRVSEIDIAA